MSDRQKRSPTSTGAGGGVHWVWVRERLGGCALGPKLASWGCIWLESNRIGREL